MLGMPERGMPPPSSDTCARARTGGARGALPWARTRGFDHAVGGRARVPGPGCQGARVLMAPGCQGANGAWVPGCQGARAWGGGAAALRCAVQAAGGGAWGHVGVLGACAAPGQAWLVRMSTSGLQARPAAGRQPHALSTASPALALMVTSSPPSATTTLSSVQVRRRHGHGEGQGAGGGSSSTLGCEPHHCCAPHAGWHAPAAAKAV